MEIQIIEPDVQLISFPHTKEGQFKAIVEAAHTCYKSARPTDDARANEEFVEKLIKNKHFTPLEFATVVLDEWIDSPYCSNLIRRGGEKVCVTNYRFVLEHGLDNSVMEWGHSERITVRWTIARGVADEFARHRALYTQMESTRYVNYSKDATMQFVKHGFAELDAKKQESYRIAFGTSAETYCGLCQDMPQQLARDVLPLGIATHLTQCATFEQWAQFLRQRTAPGVHPDARYIAQCLASILRCY